MEQVRYQPQDRNGDGLPDEISQAQQYLQQPPEDREREWIEKNLLPKRLSADLVTREIFNAQGQVVGQLPDFS